VACQSSQRASAATSGVGASGGSRREAASLGRRFPRPACLEALLRASGVAAVTWLSQQIEVPAGLYLFCPSSDAHS